MQTSPRNYTWSTRGQAQGQAEPIPADKVAEIRTFLERDAAAGLPLAVRNQALFETLYCTGLRGGDALRLTVRAVTASDGSIRPEVLVVQSKISATKARTVARPLLPRAQAALARLVAGRAPHERLFVGKGRNRALGTDALRLIVKDWVRRAGLDADDFSNHSIRRAHLQRIYVASGGDWAIVQAAAGHGDIRSTFCYLKPDRAKVRAIELDALGS